jgi:hypothetical protein
MERLLKNLKEAEERIKKIDHLLYVSFPLVQDKRLLLNAIIEIKEVVRICINIILQQEYFYRRIKIYKESKRNIKTFVDKCAVRYEINKQELKLITNLFEIVEMHVQSPLEFMKDNKLIIISDNLRTYQINLEGVKQFLNLGKKILNKTKKNIEKNLR